MHAHWQAECHMHGPLTYMKTRAEACGCRLRVTTSAYVAGPKLDCELRFRNDVLRDLFGEINRSGDGRGSGDRHADVAFRELRILEDDLVCAERDHEARNRGLADLLS